jgi:hypothetical protein
MKIRLSNISATTKSVTPFGTFNAGTSTEVECTYAQFKAAKTALDAEVTASRLKYTLDSLNIMDFGAVGNGTTDDTVAIQAAIDLVKALPGSHELLIPPGTFLFSNLNLTHIGTAFDKNLVIKGRGRHASWLKQSSAAGNALDLSGSNNITIKDLKLTTGTGATTGILTARTTVGPSCNGHQISNCMIEGGASKALIALYGAESCMIQDSHILLEGGGPALWVGAKNGPSFASSYATLAADSPAQSTIDNHVFNNTISSSINSVAIIELYEGAGISFQENFINFSGTTPKAFVYLHAPTVNQFAWPATFDHNEFEGLGDAFLFGGFTSGVVYQSYIGFKATSNWKTSGGYKWTNIEGDLSLLEGSVFEDNSGGFEVKLGSAERTKISHYETSATINITGAFNGCEIIASSVPGALTLPNGGLATKVTVRDIAFSGGTGISRDVYGGLGSPGIYGKARHQLQIKAMNGAPDSAELAEGLLMAADGVTWNPG